MPVLNEYYSDGGLFVFHADTARRYVDDLCIARAQRVIGSNANKYVLVFGRLAAQHGAAVPTLGCPANGRPPG